MATRNSTDSVDRGAAGKDDDLYGILGLSKGASVEDIKKAYRKLARKYHPDVNPGNHSSEERFKEISRAHDVLADDAKRALYDEFGAESLRGGFDAERAREYRRWQENAARMASAGSGFGDGGGFDGGRTAGGGGFGRFADFEDLFGGMFSRGAMREAPTRGADAEVPVTIELMEAIRGTARTISVKRPEVCPTCHGSGVEPGTSGAKAAACRRCGGSGTIEQSSRLNVKVPAGVETGSRVRVAGKGGSGIDGGPPGDLYIVVEVRPHPLLERQGRDLTMEVPITVGEAVLGATITVPTPDGNVSLKIPAGTQSGRRFRLRGKGVPDMRGGGRGDLYVRAMVQVPERGEAAKNAAKALDACYTQSLRAGLRL